MSQVMIALDLFPALVLTPYGARYDQARAIVVDDRLWLYVASPAGAERVYDKPVASLEGNRIAGYRVLTQDGSFVVNSGGGCGCGSILKSFDPYNGATRVGVPFP